MIRSISLEDRESSNTFNERASHTNKLDKYIDSDKALALFIIRYQISETNFLNSSDNSREINFINPLMSVNSIYNDDAHHWPIKTILKVVGPMINCINEKQFSKLCISYIQMF